MGLSVRDSERLADEIYRDRRISGTLYCANCGYCLKTLLYQQICPECGQEYNARSTVMKGIYFPHQGALPFGDFLTTLCYAAVSVALHWGAYRPVDGVRIAMAMVMSVFCLVNAYLTFQRFLIALRARVITSRIARQEEG